MKYLLVSCLVGILFISFAADTSAMKYTEVEEFYIKYDLTGNNEGSKEFVSKDWGHTQCWIEKSTMTMGGNTIEKNEKVISQIKDGEQYITTINLDDNSGKEMKNPMFGGISKGMDGKSPREFSEGLMKQMGGQKGEKKKVNNEECTQWTLMAGAFTCVTDDLIAVETGANMAGIQMLETATEVKRNNAGPDGICDVGDAKIEQINLDQLLGN
ncbi:MAG: hypothetical protein AAF462_01375 [Thermodesulfobacteriota bacterium]